MNDPLEVKTVVELDQNHIEAAIREYVERRGAKVAGTFPLRKQGTGWVTATVPVNVTLSPSALS